MVVAVITAVIVAGVALFEVFARTDPHSAFVFALLDLLVGDEAPVEHQETIRAAETETYSHRAA